MNTRAAARVGVCLTVAAACFVGAAAAIPQDVSNPTGLPMYPNLASARLEERLKTDRLGHWCMHLAASTNDPLDAVERWYRRALRTASETDLRRDGAYGDAEALDGIKLSLSLDSVAIYQTARGAATSIVLSRCSPAT